MLRRNPSPVLIVIVVVVVAVLVLPSTVDVAVGAPVAGDDDYPTPADVAVASGGIRRLHGGGDDDDVDDQNDESSVNDVIDKPEKLPLDDSTSNRIPILYPDDGVPASGRETIVDGSPATPAATPPPAEASGAGGDQGSARTAPKYMIDLYNKFSTDKYSHPMANIVRSFTNINPDTSSSVLDLSGNSTRHHRLVFNVTSVSRDEDIYLAELRLLTLIESDRNLYDGVNRRVSVYEVNGVAAAGGSGSASTTTNISYELIATKVIFGRKSGWETFTVTDAAKRWVKSRSTTQVLEVRIESVDRRHPDDATGVTSASADAASDDDDLFPPVVDVDTRPHNDNEPLLLVFSNDRRRRKFDSRELHEMIEHELETYETGGVGGGLDDEEAQYVDGADYEEDADGGVDAAGVDYPGPPVDYLPTSGAGATRVVRDTTDVLLRRADEDEDDEVEEEGTTGEMQYEYHGDGGLGVDGPEGGVGDEPRKRVSRAAKFKRRVKRNICRRKPMFVNFEDIHWDHWIIEPKGYMAYECTGRCYFPLADHLTPTKHAIVQTILNANYPKKASRTCCVPTRLDPISILYVDEAGTVTYKYKYDGMVVAECGCR